MKNLRIVPAAVLYRCVLKSSKGKRREPKTEKLTYKNDEQPINDAVRMLIENHLAWSGSDESMPSADQDNVRGSFFDARATADFTVDEWDALTDEEREEHTNKVNSRFDKAAAEADRKWEAVKVMLDL